VPFPFDAHMKRPVTTPPRWKPHCTTRSSTTCRKNKVNLRKEFFEVTILEVAERGTSAWGRWNTRRTRRR